MASSKKAPSLIRPAGARMDAGRGDHPGFIRPKHWIGKRRVLNRPLFVVSLILVAVTVPALVLIHRAMLQSQAGGLRRLAESLATEGKEVEAYEQLERYTMLVGSEDVETLQMKADLLAKAKSPSYKILHKEAMVQRQILHLKPTLTKNRRRLAELHLAIEQYQLAAAEARELLKKDKADPVGLRVLADSYYAAKDYQQAQNSYKQAIKVNPADILSYARLANCFIQAGEEKQAIAVIDQMVAKNSESGEAFYRRYIFRRSIAPEKNPVEDLEKALELAPENLDILLQAAQQSLTDAKWELARQRYQKVLDLAPKGDPNRVTAHVGIGNTYVGAREPAKAIDAWKRGLSEVGATNYPLNLRLAETLILEGELDEVQGRLNVLRKNLRDIFASTRRTAELVAYQQAIDLVEARYHVANREERKAIPLLRSAAQADLGSQQLTYDSLQLLGNLHAQFEEWDAASDCLQRAAVLRPDSLSTRAALGTALSEAGRLDEALSAFGMLSQGDRVSPLILFTLAKLHYRKQANLDRGKQSWQQFLAVLRACRENRVLPIDTTLLETSYLASIGEYGKASGGLIAEEIRLLRKMFDDVFATSLRRATGTAIQWVLAPFGQTSSIAERMQKLPVYSQKNTEDMVRLAIGMAELLDSAGKPATAEWMIDAVQRWRPGDPEVVLSKASIQASQGKFENAIKTVDDALGQLDSFSQQALLRFKSKLVAKLDDTDKILDVRAKMADAEPNNVENLTRLAEELVARGRLDEAKKRIDQLKNLEGDGGTHWRFALATLQLANVRAGHAEELPKASRLQEEIQARRPGWARGQLLGAMIALADGDVPRAIGFLKRTLQSGDRRVVIYRQLLALLLAEGELREADEYLAQLRQSLMQEPGFLPIALQLNAQRRQYSEAEVLARRAVEARPGDAQARIWLGNVLSMADKLEEAEEAYRQAIVVDPASLSARPALVRLLASQKRTDDARAVIDEMEKNDKLGERRDMLIARCYELINDVPAAKKFYLEALKKNPEDVVVLRNAVGFMVANGLPEAEDVLKRLEMKDPTDPFVRRTRAYWLVTRGDAESWNNALGLMADHDAAADLRVRALLLERLGGPDNLRQAIRLMEEVAGRTNEVTPNDRYRLALLYQRDGKLENATNHLRNIAFEEDADPLHVASCIELLLQAKRWKGEAEALLNRLEKQEPDRFRTISLRAKWLAQSGKTAQANALVKDAVEAGRSKAGFPLLLLGAARLFIQLGEFDEAEKMYRQLSEADPNGYVQLVTFLRDRRDRDTGDEAARICLAKIESSPIAERTLPLVLAAGLAGQCPVSAELDERIEKQLASAIPKSPEPIRLTRSLAERRLRQGRYEDAVDLFKKCIAAEPNNVADRNNIAIALSKLKRHTEAAEQIEHAIKYAGPKIEFLDSKGLVLLAMGNIEGALNAFYKVTTDSQAQAVHYLHLALANARANKLAESRDALQKARAKGIDIQQLSDDDRGMLGELGGLENRQL